MSSFAQISSFLEFLQGLVELRKADLTEVQLYGHGLWKEILTGAAEDLKSDELLAFLGSRGIDRSHVASRMDTVFTHPQAASLKSWFVPGRALAVLSRYVSPIFKVNQRLAAAARDTDEGSFLRQLAWD